MKRQRKVVWGMGGPWSTLFGHIDQIPLMEIFLLFVSHCVPSLSLVNSFLKNTQTLFFPFSENLPQNYPPFKRVFLAKENFLPICPLWHSSLLLGFDHGCHERVAMVPPSISLNLNLLFFTSLQLQLHFCNISSTDL